MQSYNNEKLISTDVDTIEGLRARIKELEGQATHHVIGKLPSKGDVVTVNGLRYKVISADGIEGKLRLRILRPKRR